MKALRSFNRFTTKALEVIMTVFAATMVLVCFAQVCTRMAKSPLSWSEELARYLAVWLTFLGAAYALRKRSLATVEILYIKLHGVSQKTLYAVISVIVFIFCYVMVRYGLNFAMKFMSQTSPAMQIPKGLVYVSAPVSGFLMFFYQLELLIDEIAGKEQE